MHRFNRFLTAFVCEKDPDRKEYAIGIVHMLGIGFHSFIDGFIYSIAFTVSILTGYLARNGKGHVANGNHSHLSWRP